MYYLLILAVGIERLVELVVSKPQRRSGLLPTAARSLAARTTP